MIQYIFARGLSYRLHASGPSMHTHCREYSPILQTTPKMSAAADSGTINHCRGIVGGCRGNELLLPIVFRQQAISTIFGIGEALVACGALVCTIHSPCRLSRQMFQRSLAQITEHETRPKFSCCIRNSAYRYMITLDRDGRNPSKIATRPVWLSGRSSRYALSV